MGKISTQHDQNAVTQATGAARICKRQYRTPKHQRIAVAASTQAGKNNAGFEAGVGMSLVRS
ncbi:MAG: hypothetical protein LJE69_09445 [Thiohalocapsa sp.]|jgi:hypothetical protein|uniref:hypothetical protein n=1 Tax=Thiohalocapsa sp. TaxID=2497641 RepID=UPI0025F1E16D|nr:hypothetical protein [Thiohalocapsa sp.]MCG6941462.1 hypothetical protein [Thiohalocapsa sp.]